MGSPLHRRRSRAPNFRRRTLPGAPPGTLVSDPGEPKGEIHVLAYNEDRYREERLGDLTGIAGFIKEWPVTWINVDGLGDAAIVTEIGRAFDLHKLALEDVVHVHQRAKAESYGAYYFIVARMPQVGQSYRTEQISFFFGDRFVITFQEKPGGDCLEPIRARIRSGWGRRHAIRSDYLVYALLDGIVDHYFPIVEGCGERLDEFEERVIVGPLSTVVPLLHEVKRDLVSVRRVIWPMRDAINTLLRDASPLISDETRIYLRDVHDHTIQILDLVEAYRDIAAGITEVYLARVNLRTNEIMKVLTIITTIFIPMSFIVGVYGMNFATDVSPWNMPELHWYWGYPFVLALMAALAGSMLLYFYRKGWLGKNGTNQLRPEETAASEGDLTDGIVVSSK